MRHHRHRSGGGGGVQQQQLASTPSENSIDESVKSAQVVIGKEVLEKYLEKLKTTGSVGSGQGTPGGQFWYHERHEDTPQATGVVHPFSSLASSGTGSSKELLAATSGLSSTSSSAAAAAAAMSLVRGGFSPYYNPGTTTAQASSRGLHQHHQTSSPRFSSPPPNSGSTGTADFMMSPIGHATAIGQSDFRTSATDPRYHQQQPHSYPHHADPLVGGGHPHMVQPHSPDAQAMMAAAGGGYTSRQSRTLPAGVTSAAVAAAAYPLSSASSSAAAAAAFLAASVSNSSF